MSATAAQRSAAVAVLSGLSVLTTDKYAWGQRMRLNPSETDRVWTEAMRKRTTNQLKPA